LDIDLRFEPVTTERWTDFENLFGPRGAFYDCWCVALRLPHAVRMKMPPEERKSHMRQRIVVGPPPGVLAFADGEPVGWVQVGPRHDVPQFNSPRTVSRPLDEGDATDPSLWAVSCFFLAPRFRGKGLSHRLLAGAVEHARRHGARYVEGCPIDYAKQSKSVTLCIGSSAIFDAAGFETVARRKDGRPLMRLDLQP
jgi:GNAT superfamily N-acetyltransferase